MTKHLLRIQARIVREQGFAAYCGGHHVAVHEADATGGLKEQRIALITHNAPDWS